MPLLNELEENVQTGSLLEFAGQMRLFVDADLCGYKVPDESKM